jgi:hypothetical protein
MNIKALLAGTAIALCSFGVIAGTVDLSMPPITASYALLLAGLGLVGTIIRRGSN